MKLYDEIIEKILKLTGECNPYSVNADSADWPLISDRSLILRGDMAYELGADLKPGFGATILTDNKELVQDDEVVVCGCDLNEMTADHPYVRCTLVRVRSEEMGEGNALYNAIRKMEYVRYHFYPEGFMMRVSASKNKESVRISKEALRKGIDFSKVGSRMIEAFHEQAAVEAVKIIYVTDPAFNYKEFEQLLAGSESITKTIDHMLRDVKMDCDVCNLKPVCDEVEGLRELHFAK